jgi:hypothetical protein
VLSTKFPAGFCEKGPSVPSLVATKVFNLYPVVHTFVVEGEMLSSTQRAGTLLKNFASALHYSIVPSVWAGTAY